MPDTIDVLDAASVSRTVMTNDKIVSTLGEVQASPTANTLLDRLKTIATASIPAGTNNIGDVDVLTLPALIAGSAVIGKVGIDQTTPGTTDSVTVKSNAYSSQPTVTRAANTTAYTAGDVVGGVITFTSIGPSGGHVIITNADLQIQVASVPSGMSNMRLYLYDATPGSAYVDNDAWDLPSGDRAAFLGFIDIGTPVDLGSTLFVQTADGGVGRQVKLNGSTSLFGYLVTIGAFTPAGNSEVYLPRLRTVGV